MPEISEQVSEALERAEGGGGGDREKDEHSRLNSTVAATVALVATFMTVCNVKAGNVVQAMGKTQIDIVDSWSFFQAKSTKQSLAEAAVDQLTLQRDTAVLTPEQGATLDKRLASYREKVTRYDGEKNELKKKVEDLEKDYERLNVKDDQFDISESLLSVAIAMLGITALTQKRKLLFVAMGFAGFGLVVGLAGFSGSGGVGLARLSRAVSHAPRPRRSSRSVRERNGARLHRAGQRADHPAAPRLLSASAA